MRLAWFRPAPSARPTLLDPLPALLAVLEADHQIDRIDHRSAHDVVWRHHRAPYDLFVYELADTPAHAFIWPYLFHFPGVVHLRSPSLHDSRALALHATRRSDAYLAERTFGDWDLLGAPLAAARLTVVSHPGTAVHLMREHPALPILHVPPGLDPRAISGGDRTRDPRAAHTTLRVGALEEASAQLVRRAVVRARQAGSAIDLVAGEAGDVLDRADVVVACEWPGGEWPMAALAGMARGLTTIVLETAATAGWPTLDPQSWRPRALSGSDPAIAISLDPRDEEHSLVLALRRLAADRPLCAGIAAAGTAWWCASATLAHAVDGWRPALQDAAGLHPSPQTAEWPEHLRADGTGRAQAILREMHVPTDLFANT